MSILRRVAGRLRDEQGSTLLEYAIVLPVLLAFLFGIMDFCRFLYTYHFVSEVAREGTRYAMVRGSTFGSTACTTPAIFACNATAANVQSYVQGLTPPGIASGSLAVTTTWPGTAPTGATTACPSGNNGKNPGCLVQVLVSYPFKFMLPFLPSSASTWTMSSTSVVVISQ
ncbi:MAG: TadE/TadG family type IV pilus assembly protein [Acidobacteriota bacterium]|nr:TadE/TadG family type IV pilus assembly protein [Acidobacteriota bacterium]